MVLTKWTPEMTSKFISLYRDQECLWRSDSLIYRDRDARDTALKNIIIGMNLEDLTTDDVKKKIKHLRSTYMTEINKIQKTARSGAGTSNIHKPSLTWFDQMDAFIKYVNVKRNTKSLTIPQPNNQNSESVEQTVSDTNKDTASGSMETDQQIDTNRKQQHCQKRNADVQGNATKEIPKKTDIRPSQTVSKRTRLNQLSSAVKDMKEISSELNKVDDTNEFEIYGKYVGVQLKSMNEEDAILAQQEIQSILTRFKLKKVQRDRSTSHSRLSDYESLVSPTDGRGSSDSNSQSRHSLHYGSRSTSSYDNNYSVIPYSDELDVNETDMAAVENLSAAGLQYSDVQYNVEVNDEETDMAVANLVQYNVEVNDDETDMAVANLGLITTAFRNA